MLLVSHIEHLPGWHQLSPRLALHCVFQYPGCSKCVMPWPLQVSSWAQCHQDPHQQVLSLHQRGLPPQQENLSPQQQGLARHQENLLPHQEGLLLHQEDLVPQQRGLLRQQDLLQPAQLGYLIQQLGLQHCSLRICGVKHSCVVKCVFEQVAPLQQKNEVCAASEATNVIYISRGSHCKLLAEGLTSKANH